MMKRLYRNISTLGFIGYLPAPGTCATAVAVPLAFLVNLRLGRLMGLAALISIFIVSFIAVRMYISGLARAGKINADPKEVVVYELVGTLVTFYAITLNIYTVVIGFILFRFFDILKPLFIKKLEKVPGAWGIFLDDIAAGLISNMILVLVSCCTWIWS